MRKANVILTFFMIITLLIGCSNTTTTVTVNNASPEAILKTNPEADFFVMDNTVFINASDIKWVKKLEFKEGKSLGKINKTGVKRDFKDWNATILDAETEIYEVEGRKDIVYVKTDNKYIPYLKYVEG